MVSNISLLLVKHVLFFNHDRDFLFMDYHTQKYISRERGILYVCAADGWLVSVGHIHTKPSNLSQFEDEFPKPKYGCIISQSFGSWQQLVIMGRSWNRPSRRGFFVWKSWLQTMNLEEDYPVAIKHGNRRYTKFIGDFPIETSIQFGNSPASHVWWNPRVGLFGLKGSSSGTARHHH